MDNPENVTQTGQQPETSKPNEQPVTPQTESNTVNQVQASTLNTTGRYDLKNSKLSPGVFPNSSQQQFNSQFRSQAKQVIANRLNKETKESSRRIIEQQQRIIEKLQVQLKNSQTDTIIKQEEFKCNMTKSSTDDMLSKVFQNKLSFKENVNLENSRFIEQSKFYGKENEDIEDWIFTIETNFMINRTPEDLKIAYAQFFLRDVALGEFKTLIKLACSEKKEITWQKFLASFRTRFRQLNYEANQFKKFMDIKQTENQSVKGFIHRLQPNLQTFVASQNPNSLDEAIIKALSYENAHQYVISTLATTNLIDNNNQVNDVNYMNRNSTLYCYYCGKEGHYTNRCRHYYNDRRNGIYNPRQPYKGPNKFSNNQNNQNNRYKQNNRYN